jgi:secreted trypsin-like serine protease
LGRLEDGGSLPGTLQEAQVGLSDFDDCDVAYSDGGLLSFLTGLSESSQFCAAGPGIDSCQGDSGGPLILSSSSDTTTDVQLGLVSFGSGCAQAEFPGKWLSYVTIMMTLPSSSHTAFIRFRSIYETICFFELDGCHNLCKESIDSGVLFIVAGSYLE